MRHPPTRGRTGAGFLGWPTWAQVLVVFAASRLVSAALIAVAAVTTQNPAGVGTLHPGYADLVVIWDGEWYRQIAEQGYPSTLPLGLNSSADYNAWAFFPLFPMLVRGLMAVGLPFVAAATTVNLAAGYAAALLLQRLFTAAGRPDRRLALLAVALWCVLPAAPVLQAAYTEALAALLLAAALLLLVRRHYLWAAGPVLLLGLTRAVAAPLLVVVMWHVAMRWRGRRSDSFGARERWSLAGLLAATGLSAATWPLLVGWATGVPDAFLQTQARWGQRPADGPFVPWISWAWEQLGVVGVVALLAVVAVWVHLVLGRHGAWLASELRVWAVAYPLYLLAVVRPITSMWRFLLLDLPVAAILASLVVRGRWAQQVSWTVRAVLLGAVALAGMTWWTLALLTRIPWADNPP